MKQHLDPSKTKTSNVKHINTLKYYKLISNVLVSKSNILKLSNLTEFTGKKSGLCFLNQIWRQSRVDRTSLQKIARLYPSNCFLSVLEGLVTICKKGQGS